MKLLLVFITCLLTVGCAEHRVRRAEWALPVTNASLDNFYQVSKGIYRSEQPRRHEFQVIKKLGISEVLNLREYHSNDDETEDLNLKLHRIRTDAGDITEDQIIQALEIINKRQSPILIHCWHGADRTGAVVAAYRVIMQGWTKEAAIEELVEGGYGHHGWFYPNIVELIQGLDVVRINAQLGLGQNQFATNSTPIEQALTLP